ncbi:hypothetical protein ACFQZI_14935 [Mucilaginibacter lutimaris]|uniref:GLPGLI family protein n=1 Tax=Mucilaginibacter lutimaris TaxID=931629 RepID=A0ABW2ZJ71_9SPHI
MKKKILFIAIVLIGKCIDACSQRITCVDTVTTTGYYYKIRYQQAAGVSPDESGIHQKAYFLTEKDARKKTIGQIFRSIKGEQTDSVKFLGMLPPLNSYLEKMMETSCRMLYQGATDPDKRITPAYWYALPRTSQTREGNTIGFTRVKVRWLHLRVPDYVARDHFNYPFTLDEAYVKQRNYDIYIPLQILYLENKVQVRHHKVYTCLKNVSH